jgi:hypothetical protein
LGRQTRYVNRQTDADRHRKTKRQKREKQERKSDRQTDTQIDMQKVQNREERKGWEK